MSVARPLISVVDDDQSVRESLPDLLVEFGFRARTFSAADAFLASDCIGQTRCLILDVAMPGMTGPDLQRELGRQERRIPIVYITAERDETVRRRLLRQGAVECLFKPFSDAALLEALGSALGGRVKVPRQQTPKQQTLAQRRHPHRGPLPMTSPVPLKPPADLKSSAVRSVAGALNGILADSFALYFKTRNFHWHVSGPHFRDYHRLFDEQAAQILAATDDIAGRVRKTGNTTLRSIGDIARHQSVTDNDEDFVAPGDMLKELRDDNLRLVEVLRDARDLADSARDNATAAMIDDWTDQAEGRAWFLFEAGRPG